MNFKLISTNNLYSERTNYLAKKLPSWMDLREKESVFQQLENYAAANPLDDLSDRILKVLNTKFIDKVDESLSYISFKTKVKNFMLEEKTLELENPADYIAKFKGKYIKITINEIDFILSEEEKCFYDLKKGLIHFKQPYLSSLVEEDNNLKIINLNNKNEYFLKKELIEHRIWNPFDEFGFLFDLERIPKEDNKSYKERILDVNKNPGSSTRQGLINHISRELGLKHKDVKIRELNDVKYRDSYIKNGLADKYLVSIAKDIRDNIPLFWNELKWDEDYWDIVDENGYGYDYLPVLTD